MKEEQNRTSGTSTIKRLVGRLRGSSFGGSSTPRQEYHTSPRTPPFKIRTPRISQSPDPHSISSSRNRRGKIGGQSKDAQLCLDLWNAAYDALRDDPSCSGLVVAYENIISQELPDHLKMGGLNSSFRGKSSEGRTDLLREIAAAGLEKRRGSSASRADDLAKWILDSARDQVEILAADYTAASVAWTGFCTLTPLLLDAIVQRESFRNGLIHVVGRIPWYIHAAQLLIPGFWEDDYKFREDQKSIKEKLIELNRRVLEFEMNCVCATASAWNNAARNVVGWNTMVQLVNNIIELDEQIAEIVRQNGSGKAKTTLLMQYRDMNVSSWGSTEGVEPHCASTSATETRAMPLSQATG